MIRPCALLAASLVLIPLGCGSSTRNGSATPAGGAGSGHSASGADAGVSSSANASSGGGNSTGGNASAGTSSGNAGTSASSGNATAGSVAEPGGGAGGEGGEASTGPINTDFSWALWPMPNTPSSGLPHPMSYDTSVDGIVTDDVTGLIWQAERAPFFVQPKDAPEVCKALNLGGHTDWRLPSRLELVSLMAVEPESTVDSQAFPASPYGDAYWSSSPNVSSFGSFWVLGGALVYQSTVGAEEEYAVRCVRSLPRPLPTTPHYQAQPDVVHDTWTGLWWERTPLSLWRDYDTSKAYCDNLTLGGYSDWYFPSVKEMLTIVDEHKAWPALDTEAFPGGEDVVSGWTWSSTLLPATDSPTPWAFATRFGDGFTWHELLPGGWLTRCARQDP